MKGVALLQTDVVGPANTASGATHFFIDIFDRYHQQADPTFRLYFLTDKASTGALKKDTRFRKCFKYILPLWSPNHRFNDLVANIDLLWKIVMYRISVLHICQYYHVTHYRRLRFLNRLPSFIRPKLAINWIHCNFPYEYFDKDHYNYTHFHERFDPLFNNIRLDGIFSWYELTKTFLEQNHLLKSQPLIYPITKYCCASEKFRPAATKQNWIVWAARLHKQKRPALFVEAVNWLHKNHPQAIRSWKFILCGNGATEENSIRELIVKYKLEEVIELRTTVNDMSDILNQSKCFVSTQDYENFTSLSMNEALASGNAIIARNVGQTNLYVEDGRNGYLADSDSPVAIGQAILAYITRPEKHRDMEENSLLMVRNTHNPANFIREADDFWSQLLEHKTNS